MAGVARTRFVTKKIPRVCLNIYIFWTLKSFEFFFFLEILFSITFLYIFILFTLTFMSEIPIIVIYIYAFRRRFYPKRLTVHSGYAFSFVSMCSLGIEPTTFALLTQCSTTEPQEHTLCNVNKR